MEQVKRVCSLHGMDFNWFRIFKVTRSSFRLFVHTTACMTSPICFALLLLHLVKTEVNSSIGVSSDSINLKFITLDNFIVIG